VSLSPVELARLHVEDGLMAVSELDEESLKAFDPDVDALFRATVREALRPPVSPSIVHDVMGRIGTVVPPVADAVRTEADASASVVGAVMDRIGVASNPGRMLGEAIRVEGGELDSVWPGVAAAIGADVGIDLGGLLRGAIEEESEHMPVGWGSAARPRWVIPAAAGVVIAAAAALLLWVSSTGTGGSSVVEKIAEGPVDIEALEVGAASAVQVLQLGEDAPTIILIEEETAPVDGAK